MMSDSPYECLGEDGAIELLCEIDPDGSRWTELEDELSMSGDTLTDRLKALEAAGLLDHVAQTGGQGTTAPYKLSPTGATFRRALHESGTILMYRQLKAARAQFEEQKEKMEEWGKTELSEFDEKRHEGNLRLLLDDEDIYADESVLPDVTQDDEL